MLLTTLSVIFGLIVGSFLNVVINRLKLKETLGGRSHCPHCKKELKNIHLVPVFSYLALGGRCAYCRKKISAQYPLVEAGTALTFAFVYNQFGLAPETLFLCIISCFLIVIAVYDFKHFIIPDKVVFPGIGVALVFALFQDFSNSCVLSWNCATVSGLAGVAIIAGFFLTQYVISQGKWIGFGDVKFGILLGLAVGLTNSVVLLFMAYTVGAIFGVMLISLGKKELTSKMPFGTFLAVAGLLTLVWGTRIADWYLNLIGF